MKSYYLDWTHVRSPRLSSYSPRVICKDGELKSVQVVVFDDRTSPWTLVREGISIQSLIHHKAKLPELYIDMAGNIRRSKDDKLIMMGPNWSQREEDKRQEPPF